MGHRVATRERLVNSKVRDCTISTNLGDILLGKVANASANNSVTLIGELIVTIRMLLFVGRSLNHNQLKDLPKGVFDRNTDLMWL